MPELFERHARIAHYFDVERTETNTDGVRNVPVPGADIDDLLAVQFQMVPHKIVHDGRHL